MNRQFPPNSGLKVRSNLTAGAVVCYDNTNGYLTPVITPCSTWPDYYPDVNPFPPQPDTSGVQWLSCQQCTGTQLAKGQLSGARCEVCYM